MVRLELGKVTWVTSQVRFIPLCIAALEQPSDVQETGVSIKERFVWHLALFF